ncbi:hypothetical protein SAMN04487846_0096 [Microbacterium sp. cf046]|uniref:MarR family winged helix-turn-helix transcriptional regulator n=1 Tax=Microbacterium sp. cf046 TaxID=1761803 RepID=UPI0008EAF79B|nr:hypothetical protein [Microbacterium sp. cf046]SFR86730.1 hypothetical protein SAMN04487846_0096 [Microbacterium sp. cf046]
MNNEDTDFNRPSDEGTAGTAREGVPTERTPLGFWLRTVDSLITREFAAAFDGAEIDRRDWMLLNALSGDVELPPFAERFIRKGKRLRGLEDRGWVEESGDGTWVLTDEGRTAKEQLATVVDGIRSRVAGAVSPEDYATTVASLEAIARELGWEEGQRMPRRGFGRGRGFSGGRGFGPGFGRGFGPGFRPGFGPGSTAGFGPGFGRGFGPGFSRWDDEAARGEGHGPRGEHPCHEHPAHHAHGHDAHRHGGHHGHGGHGGRGKGERSGRGAEQAYERGFDAGFARGRSGAAVADAANDTV